MNAATPEGWPESATYMRESAYWLYSYGAGPSDLEQVFRTDFPGGTDSYYINMANNVYSELAANEAEITRAMRLGKRAPARLRHLRDDEIDGV